MAERDRGPRAAPTPTGRPDRTAGSYVSGLAVQQSFARSIMVASTSSASRVHQLSPEKISTST